MLTSSLAGIRSTFYLALLDIELNGEKVQAIVYHEGQYVDDKAAMARKEILNFYTLILSSDLLSLSNSYNDKGCSGSIYKYR